MFYLFKIVCLWMADDTEESGLTVSVTTALFSVCVCVISLPLCDFSELVPAYDSSTFVLVNFR